MLLDLAKLILLIVVGLGLNPVAADERLDLLKNISAAGAPLLTLKMLDQAQPGIDENLYEWILWEQERLSILAEWQQWDQLLIRVETLPVDIPEQFRQQAATFKANAPARARSCANSFGMNAPGNQRSTNPGDAWLSNPTSTRPVPMTRVWRCCVSTRISTARI